MTEKRKDDKNRVLKEGEHQRPNGTYEYKWRDKRGSRHSVYAKTLSELREKEIEVLRDVLDGIREDGASLTINDLYYKWEQIKRGLKDNTFQNYRYMYKQFVEPEFGKAKITDLKRSDVRAFYNYLSDQRELKASTIDAVHTVLHQVIGLGVDDNYIRYNPSDNALKELKRAKGNDSEKRRALTIAQQELLESFLRKNGPHHRWYPIFIVMLWTGLRVGEATGLRWEDIDMENGTIDINHTLVYYSHSHGRKGSCYFSINTPKTEAGKRIVPMLPIVKEAFSIEKQYQDEVGITCQSVVDGYTDFVFLNRFGCVQHYGTLNKAIQRIIRDCNFEVLDSREGNENLVLLPNFSNHSLRHTFTTRMCEAGVNMKAMQDILGHADAETTMDIYAEATKDLKQTEMIGFAEFFDKIKTSQNKAV